jgi:hypothetical protein
VGGAEAAQQPAAADTASRRGTLEVVPPSPSMRSCWTPPRGRRWVADVRLPAIAPSLALDVSSTPRSWRTRRACQRPHREIGEAAMPDPSEASLPDAAATPGSPTPGELFSVSNSIRSCRRGSLSTGRSPMGGSSTGCFLKVTDKGQAVTDELARSTTASGRRSNARRCLSKQRRSDRHRPCASDAFR